MRDAYRGRGRGRGGGWRGSQRASVPEPLQQQWKSGPGMNHGPESRHFNPREARARPEREAEPPHGPLPAHSPAPHRRRHQGQGLRRERAAPYEQRLALGAHGGLTTSGRGGSRAASGAACGGMEAAVVGAPVGCAGAMPVCNNSAICVSVYADQLIDYYTGKICPRRFRVAYNEVCKLVRLSEALPLQPGHVFPSLVNSGGGRGAAEIDQGALQGPLSNGAAVPPHSAPDADGMSEVSQVEEGEVDDEAPAGIHGVPFGSPGGPLVHSVTPQQPGAAPPAAPSSVSVVANTPNFKAPGGASPAPPLQQQSQIAGVSALRRDPRLAARARAEATGQQQAQLDTPVEVQQQQQPEAPQAQQQQQQVITSGEQSQQQARLWDPDALPPALRRQPLLSGKLPLLLDLDNTLLHAQAVGVAGYQIALEDWLDEDGLPEVYKFELPCNRKVYYLKLRPGLRRFLKALAPVFELSIYTNATQEYADLVVAILDPDRTLFGDR